MLWPTLGARAGLFAAAGNAQELDVGPRDPVFNKAGSGCDVPPHVNDHASGSGLTCHVEQALRDLAIEIGFPADVTDLRWYPSNHERHAIHGDGLVR
jgi:hypothetical protein